MNNAATIRQLANLQREQSRDLAAEIAAPKVVNAAAIAQWGEFAL